MSDDLLSVIIAKAEELREEIFRLTGESPGEVVVRLGPHAYRSVLGSSRIKRVEYDSFGRPSVLLPDWAPVRVERK